MKAGITYASRVTTVSPTYAREIMTDYYGEGLDGVLRDQGWKVQGILNGIDIGLYNPEKIRRFLPAIQRKHGCVEKVAVRRRFSRKPVCRKSQRLH